MRLSDALKSQRAELVERLEKLSKTAADEQREFNAGESADWDAATKEARELEARIERQVASEQLRRDGKGQRVAIDAEGNEHPILTRDMKLSDRHPPRDGHPLNLAKTIRGIATGDWSHAEYEQRAMSVGSLPGGGYSVPAELSSMWIDLARAKSVCVAAGAATVPMESMTLRIASIVGDVVPTFRPENVALPEADVTFGALDLKARLIGVVCRASLELISDSPNASEMITASITQSLGVAMDAAMLKGDGVVDATHDNPLGILAYPNVNAIAAVGALVDFDKYLDGMQLIEASNLTPTAVVNSPKNGNTLRKLVSGIAGDKSKLVAPDEYLALQRFVTTSMPDTSAIIGDFSNAMFGMRESVTIEATRVGENALKNVQILIRGYMRLDTGLTRAKAFTKLTGIA